MNDAFGQLLPAAEKVHHIPVGVPDMENDGLLKLHRQIHLLRHDAHLHVPGRQIVIVIQADFPQGPDPGMGQHFGEPV